MNNTPEIISTNQEYFINGFIVSLSGTIPWRSSFGSQEFKGFYKFDASYSRTQKELLWTAVHHPDCIIKLILDRTSCGIITLTGTNFPTDIFVEKYERNIGSAHMVFSSTKEKWFNMDVFICFSNCRKSGSEDMFF